MQLGQPDLTMATATHCFACNELLEELVYSCQFCNKGFHQRCCLSTAAEASRHSDRFICTFGCLQAFEAGIRAGRQQREKMSCSCPDCGKEFSTRSNLQQHIQSKHNGVRYGPCLCCDPPQLFTTRQKLRQHVRARRIAIADELSALSWSALKLRMARLHLSASNANIPPPPVLMLVLQNP